MVSRYLYLLLASLGSSESHDWARGPLLLTNELLGGQACEVSIVFMKTVACLCYFCSTALLTKPPGRTNASEVAFALQVPICKNAAYAILRVNLASIAFAILLSRPEGALSPSVSNHASIVSVSFRRSRIETWCYLNFDC